MATSSASCAVPNSVNPPTSHVGRGPRIFLYAAVALILLTTVMRAAVCWRNDTWVDHPSGVIIAMAADLKDGIFYRPLFGPEGYGGTRYFPLYFVLHAALLKLGFPVLPSAYLVSAAAVLALLVGAFYLLRGLGVERWLAACGSGTILAAASAQMAVTNPHGDGLASALNICGLAVIVRPKLNHRLILLAAIPFTLAWSAKFNMVFGVAAAVIWLLARGQRRTAGQLAAATGVGCLLVAVVMMVASHGHVWEVFKACASGGTSLRLMRRAARHVWAIANRADPGLILFFFLAVFALMAETFSQRKKLLQNLPVVFLLTTLAVTIPIFGSPGVVANHLIDLQIASVVLFTAWLANEASARLKQLGVCALALATFVAAVPLLHKLKVWDRRFEPHRFQRVLAAIKDTHRPILAENPIIPVLAGQRTYVLDAWMLRMLRDRVPNFGDPLLEGMRHRAFGAVVLSFADPRTPRARMWYTYSDFGPGFLEALAENYRLAAEVEDQMIYVPITDRDSYNPSPR
jgi:hypothetical protein